jgi:RNA polymerase sigma factor (sigma-70 family)
MSDADKEKLDRKTGHLAEMEAIVAEHETQLLRYATRIVNNPTIAQDVVQNAFIKLFKAWKPGTQPSAQMKSWLYRVTHNEAVDHIRKESRMRGHHDKQADETDACPDGHNCPPTFESKKEMVLSLISKLKQHEQQVILLRLDQGLSYKEISDITGRSEGNVGNILHHAVKQLSGLIKKSKSL